MNAADDRARHGRGEGARLGRGGADRAARAEVAGHQPGRGGLVERPDGVDQRAGGQVGLDPGPDLMRCPGHARRGQLVLAAREVVVERPGDDVAGLEDVLHPGAVVAAVGEQRGGGVEQAGAAVHGGNSLAPLRTIILLYP